jgi:hypothetical protein
MRTIKAIFRELMRLFVDDGSLALAIMVVVLFAAFLTAVAPSPLIAGAVLLVGCLSVLVANVHRSLRMRFE